MNASARVQPNVLTIAPGVPFLPTFATALLDGRVVPGLSRRSGPYALARTTIYVPTQRARRALAVALAEAAGGALLLPRIAALGALDDQEPIPASDDALAREVELPQAVGELERRLTLTRLVLAWTRELEGAIVSAEPDGLRVDTGRTLLVGTSPADAFALAGEVGDLIDEFIIEGVDPERLRDVAGAEHDRYWQITTKFLSIAFALWPQHLAERGMIDAAQRRVTLARSETARLSAARRTNPFIVLGSTGTNEATAQLMSAICRLPNGAIVLPGLDTTMPDAVFRSIGGAGRTDADERAFGHPQAALKRLLATLDVARDAVIELAREGMSMRMRAVSDALRPAESTSEWPEARARYGLGALIEAFAQIDIIEAADEREEALAVAIVFREVLETEGRTAALVTPNRLLAQRVRSEMERWSISVEDSAGVSLAQTPSGGLAQLLLAAVTDSTDANLAAILAHPRARLGRDRAEIARLAMLIEIGVFRATYPKRAPPGERVEAAKELAKERGAHPAARRISARDWGRITRLLRDLDDTLLSLRTASGTDTIAKWATRHRDVLLQIAGGQGSDSEDEVVALLEDQAIAGSSLRLDLREYRSFFDRLSAGRTTKQASAVHPRLKILGLLEARLLSADVVVLGGLDEAIWPPVVRSDPFLNRPMRLALGLSPPERRIGQTAHDFWMAAGGDRVILTRARKRGGAPTTPSRFLQRLSAFVGADLDASRERGDRYVRLARALDAPVEIMRLQAPAPKPTVALRPKRLSVTRIETLIRDPYAIYAEQVLELAKLGALDEAPSFAEQGTAVHRAIQWLSERFGVGPIPPEADGLLAIEADRLLADLHEDASWRAFRRPRLLAGLRFMLAYHRVRQPELAALHVETRGRWPLSLPDGETFTLSAEADRIEVMGHGGIRIIDFKTGSPPSKDEVAVGLSPQLTLEAAMVAAGAFPGVPASEVTDILYMKVGGKEGGAIIDPTSSQRPLRSLVAEHRIQLQRLVEAYQDPAKGYSSRPIAKYATRYSDFDHLARVKEWSATSGVASDA